MMTHHIIKSSMMTHHIIHLADAQLPIIKVAKTNHIISSRHHITIKSSMMTHHVILSWTHHIITSSHSLLSVSKHEAYLLQSPKPTISSSHQITIAWSNNPLLKSQQHQHWKNVKCVNELIYLTFFHCNISKIKSLSSVAQESKGEPLLNWLTFGRDFVFCIFGFSLLCYCSYHFVFVFVFCILGFFIFIIIAVIIPPSR